MEQSNTNNLEENICPGFDKKLKPGSYDLNMTDLEKKGDLLLEIGLTELFKKNYDKALEFIEEAHKVFLQFKDIGKIAVCLAELALIHYRKSPDRLIRSLTLLNDARYLIESHKEKNEIEAKILHYYGIMYYSEKRYSDGLKYYKNAQKLIPSDCLEYARILDSLAIFYLRVNNHQIALQSLNESIKIKKPLNNNRELAITEILIGRFLLSIENFEEAVSYLEEAIKIAEEIGDNLTLTRLLDEIAKAYISLGQYKQAEELCNKSINLAKESYSPFSMAFSLLTLANIKLCNNEYDYSLNILENEVEPIFTSNPSARGLGFVKKAKSIIYTKLSQYELAVELMHEAIGLFSELNMSVEMAKCYFELGNIYIKNHDTNLASSSLLEALRIARAKELPIFTKKIEDILFDMDQNQWVNIINKEIKKEDIFTESRTLLDALTIIGNISKLDNYSKDPLLSLLKIGRSIAAETDVDKLIEIIAEETRKSLSADRCTLYLLDKSTNELWSKIALGMGSQEIRFSSHLGLAGYVATTGKTINIKDAYNDPRFNKEIDRQTGYKTKTMLCMPMRNISHEITWGFSGIKQAKRQSFYR